MRYSFPAGGTAPTAAARPQAESRLPLRFFVGVVVAAQLLGGAIGLAILVRGAPAEAATLGQVVDTSYGVVSVDQVETIDVANPDRDTLVAGLTEVQVAVTMTNLLSRPVSYTRRQVRLRVVGSPTSIPVSSASIYAGRLPAGSAFRMIYRFDVPSAATHLLFEFRDPGRRAPVRVDLGYGPFPVGLSSAYNQKLHQYTPHGYGGGR